MVYVSIFKVWNGDEPPTHCPCNCYYHAEMKSWSIGEYEGVHIFKCDSCDVFVTWIPDYLSKPGEPTCPSCGGYASRSPCKHCGNDVGMEDP